MAGGGIEVKGIIRADFNPVTGLSALRLDSFHVWQFIPVWFKGTVVGDGVEARRTGSAFRENPIRHADDGG